jgi:hypothetical protein
MRRMRIEKKKTSVKKERSEIIRSDVVKLPCWRLESPFSHAWGLNLGKHPVISIRDF